MLEWTASFPVDIRRALSVHARGPRDPAFRIDETGSAWRTSLTPEGPATVRVTARPDGPKTPEGPRTGPLVRATAWGPGAAWLLDTIPAQLGFYDDISSFDPAPHPVVRQFARRHADLRIGRTNRVFEALVPAILEQKVVSIEAHRAWKFLLTKHGTTPPGPAPAGMRVTPEPHTWKRIPSWDWHKAGVEAVRARTIMGAATVAHRLEQNPTDAALQSIPGIGPWTSAETRQRANGDPDAVSVGDYNLPKAVGWVLAGRESTDDATMLDLLAPYKGHRHRVARLIELSGQRPPRKGPRMPVRDYRSF
jgi:3-methyladenine DNA glycosylase/8-oxoguanine DNA glycosylase